jgi:transposase InsO family protein
MRVIFERSDRTYGSPRLYRALVGLGYPVSHRRVERLMRQVVHYDIRVYTMALN